MCGPPHGVLQACTSSFHYRDVMQCTVAVIAVTRGSGVRCLGWSDCLTVPWYTMIYAVVTSGLNFFGAY